MRGAATSEDGEVEGGTGAEVGGGAGQQRVGGGHHGHLAARLPTSVQSHAASGRQTVLVLVLKYQDYEL